MPVALSPVSTVIPFRAICASSIALKFEICICSLSMITLLSQLRVIGANLSMTKRFVLQSLVVGVRREEGLDVVDDGVVSLEFVEVEVLELSVGDS